MYQSMIKLLLISMTCFSILHACQSQEELPLNHTLKTQNYFNPETYICYQSQETLKIDGKDDEPIWKSTPWTKSFVDIEGKDKAKPILNTQVRMLWDSTHLYVFAKMEEPHIWATLKNRDDIIFHDDDFEIFIDPDGDSHNYYELEWNAFNTLWDLILLRPYRVDNKPKVLFEWNVTQVKSAVHLEGTINDNSDIDEFWSIEIAIPWFALNELAPQNQYPQNGDQWRINFSRVDWTMEEDGKGYRKSLDQNQKVISENNWVWSPTGKINMHMPEMWGYVQFSKNHPNQKTIFNENPDENIKWGLWQLYWQQLSFYKENNRYSATIGDFNVPLLKECNFNPQFYITPFSFEITNPSCDNNGNWLIDKNGKIELFGRN